MQAMTDPGEPSPDTPLDEAKLAQRVARLLEKEVLESGWLVGTPIGSEMDLAARFGVSRSVLREAVSITEHDGLIVSRRGRYGGLRIAAPALDAIRKSVRNYLHYASVDIQSILEARLILENLMIDFVSRNMSEADYLAISTAAKAAGHKPVLRSQIDLIMQLLAVGNNPALTVFFISLIDLILMKIFQRDIPPIRFRKFENISASLRLKYVDAMYGLDLNSAHDFARQITTQVQDLLNSSTERDQGDEDYPLRIAIEMMVAPEELPLPFKDTELLTHRLHREIVRKNWPIGESLGTEAELLKRFNVGRNVLREAIRPLERMGIVRMRQRVGLVVEKSDPAATIRSVVLYLNHAGLTREKTYFIQNELELAGAGDIASLPIELRKECAKGLLHIAEQQAPTTIESAQERVKQFYVRFIQYLPNQVIAFFLKILCELVSLEKSKTWTDEDLRSAWAGIQRAQCHFAECIKVGNKAMVRRAMFNLKAELDVLMPINRPASEIVESPE